MNAIKLYPGVEAGGRWRPAECRPLHKIAIVVPYRNRPEHLRVFLHNIHHFLGKQRLDYGLFLVEQIANQTFNRGKLMNVGFLEASRLADWDCFAFHDVDLLPEDDRNLYYCPSAEDQPRHLSVAVDTLDYRLPYPSIFGGATILSAGQFRALNGFSNAFWGWGGEDDDFSQRLFFAGFTIGRYPKEVGRYRNLPQDFGKKREATAKGECREKANCQEQGNPINECRFRLMAKTRRRWRSEDGLTTLAYRLPRPVEQRKLYTRILVDLLEAEEGNHGSC